MNSYTKLKKHLDQKPYLIADASSGRVRLATENATLKALLEGGEFPSACIMNAKNALINFARLRDIGKADHEFNSRDIARIAGMSLINLWQWSNELHVIKPSVHPFSGKGMGHKHEAVFSWCDAYCAGIIGSLRRHGMRPGILRKVQPMFNEIIAQKTTDQNPEVPVLTK